ncbi:MAG: hypothetical protein P1V97_12685 [Planctomycetota bacterium]|nr:hypothetical protein [Planctomycetota bacterium]
MRQSQMHLGSGQTISFLVSTDDGVSLLQCEDAALFLDHFLEKGPRFELPHGGYIRGFVSREEGAYFDLRDKFGLVRKDILHLDYETAQNEILDRLW